MPIVEVRTTDLEQECAVCGASRSVPLAGLDIGVEIAPGVSDSSVIALPVCASCTAQEFLICTAPTEVIGQARDESALLGRHQLLVRQLHAALARSAHLESRTPEPERVAPSRPDAGAH